MSFTKGFDEYDGQQETTSLQLRDSAPDCYTFTPKHQYALKNNPLCGICLPQWIRLVKSRWRDIEWKTYWPRIMFLTAMACINSVLAIPEHLLFAPAIRVTQLHDAPVFVLGHPRTGTTLLHGLLALDAQRFAYCNTFCAGFASCFLWFERFGKVLFRGVIDDHRPMDMVKLDFDLPQEDELATTVLTGGISGYMPLYFMRQEPQFRTFYAFEEEEGASLPSAEIASARSTWITAFLWLCRKLTLRAGSTKPLLLKSPVHTARIRLLRSLFPNAKFVYMHRNPYDVFRSACHMADTTYWYTFLNTPSDSQIQEFILQQYEILWDYYERDRQLLRPDQLIEISFDQLTADPVETLRVIYEHFGWSFVSDMEGRLKQEESSVRSFQRNKHAELPIALAEIVADRWGASFKRLGYSTGYGRHQHTSTNM